MSHCRKAYGERITVANIYGEHNLQNTYGNMHLAPLKSQIEKKKKLELIRTKVL